MHLQVTGEVFDADWKTRLQSFDQHHQLSPSDCPIPVIIRLKDDYGGDGNQVVWQEQGLATRVEPLGDHELRVVISVGKGSVTYVLNRFGDIVEKQGRGSRTGYLLAADGDLVGEIDHYLSDLDPAPASIP